MYEVQSREWGGIPGQSPSSSRESRRRFLAAAGIQVSPHNTESLRPITFLETIPRGEGAKRENLTQVEHMPSEPTVQIISVLQLIVEALPANVRKD